MTCRRHDDPDDTISVAMRLLLACLTDDSDGYWLTFDEVRNCPDCLRSMINILSYGWCLSEIHHRRDRGKVIASFEKGIATQLDELAQ